MSFDLLANPFAALELTTDASAAVVNARARELATAEAEAAGRELLLPRTRLLAELSYLPGVSSAIVEACLRALKAGCEPDTEPLDPLARANVLAHLASRKAATADHLRDLAGLQDSIRSTAAEVTAAACYRAKVRAIPAEMLDAALDTLAIRHAEAFTEGILALPAGTDLFASQLRTVGRGATPQASFLRRSAAAWDRATASEAAQYLESATAFEIALRDRASPKTAGQLAAIVLRFANRTGPPREACRLVGLPHQVSMNAAQRWRAVALDLNNRQDAVAEAVTVLDALVRGFGTDDELGCRTERDLEICRERLASGEGTAEMRRLAAAIGAATEQEIVFQRAAMVGGRTTPETPDVVRELHDAFAAAARAARSDLPWRLLRAFMLRLHNEFSATAAALSFTQLAIAQGAGRAIASDAVRQLELDLRTLRRAQATIELGIAIRTKQRSAARRLLTELMTLADDTNEWNECRAVLRRLNKQQTAERLKYGFYAVLGLIALFWFVNSQKSEPTTPGALNDPALPSSYNQTAPSDYAAPASPPPFDPDARRPKTQPAPGAAVTPAPSAVIPVYNAAPTDSDAPAPVPRSFASTIYAQGQADRRIWETWFSRQNGAFRDGAGWWADVRSNVPRPTCDDVPAVERATAMNGCMAARTYLDGVDRRRHAEPQYRAGWNNP